MKAEFELTIDDKTGEPIIVFKHHDRNGSLEQKLLKRFLDSVSENGIELVHQNGFLEAGTNNSWEKYAIMAISPPQSTEQ